MLPLNVCLTRSHIRLALQIVSLPADRQVWAEYTAAALMITTRWHTEPRRRFHCGKTVGGMELFSSLRKPLAV